jgi:hypothetical protein
MSEHLCILGELMSETEKPFLCLRPGDPVEGAICVSVVGYCGGRLELKEGVCQKIKEWAASGIMIDGVIENPVFERRASNLVFIRDGNNRNNLLSSIANGDV